MSRLLLVEGIPGSGKTTTARRLAALLAGRGLRSTVFLEGEPRPGDLAWQWWLAAEELEDLLRAWPAAAETLRAATWTDGSGASLAYNQVDRAPFGDAWADLALGMAEREPFNGVVTAERFVDILAQRWAALGADEASRPGYVILESALLQNTLVELVLFAQWQPEQIAAALGRLLETVAALDPVVLRLCTPDVAATVAAASAERLDADGRPWWQEASRAFTVATPWARARGLTPADALTTYLESRIGLEDRVAPGLPARWIELASPGAGGAPDAWARFDEDLDALVAGLVAERPDSRR